ncbi:MAG: HEAT repeat domain-containing protein [Planctomycetes bacterium]|nr:HEAT repeat domain-containing protein [Planctomycetota bacterium]
MKTGLSITFETLAANGDTAAARVLIAALDSPDAAVCEGAFRALLASRNPAGHREVLQRLPALNAHWKAIVEKHRGRLSGALRNALLSSDPQTHANACQTAIWFREYDLIPVLLTVMEDPSNPNAERSVATMTELVELLDRELTDGSDSPDRRDPQWIRTHVTQSLQLALQKPGKPPRPEVIEAFVLLAGPGNDALGQILHDPHHSHYLPIIDFLKRSDRTGVIDLLLACLDDPHVPSSIFLVIAKRHDLEFVVPFLAKTEDDSPVVAKNLKRIRSLDWLTPSMPILDQLDGPKQGSAVSLIAKTGIPPSKVFASVEHLLLHGKREGRRAAAEALGAYRGAEANTLALRSLDDEDPVVQAAILLQLRRRSIPGVFPRMVELIDSPHPEVRQATRESLGEFSFRRYLGAFDMLEEDVRYTTGQFVKKIDTQTIPLLREEMTSGSRGRRLRALEVVRTIDAVAELDDAVIALLDDKDHIVRALAASVLALSGSVASREGLQNALLDSSVSVRESARESLQYRDHLTQRAHRIPALSQQQPGGRP